MSSKRYVFFDKHNLGAPWNQVHPYNQANAKKIVDKIRPKTTHIILFGSSTNYCCHEDSDIDLCLIGATPEDIQGLDLEGISRSLIYYDDLETFVRLAKKEGWSLEKEINQTGVLLHG